MKTFFLLLTFFFPGQGWYVQPLTCEDTYCVQQMIDYGATSSSSLFRVRVFTHQPVRWKAGEISLPPLVNTPDLDIWIH